MRLKNAVIGCMVPLLVWLRASRLPPTSTSLLEVVSTFLNGRKPNIASHSVCVECKLRGTSASW